ncbi:MAG: ABC transporter permease [Deltaproteobacteria bacterium]|nr:ABC transporter permease [Deltaproteobacteria bacterium]
MLLAQTTYTAAEIIQIVVLTLRVTLSAIVLAVLLGLPAGIALALSAFPGRKIVLAIINTLMGLPPVIAGLAVALALWRNGPLGPLQLIYTKTGIVIAQCIIAAPIIAGLTASAIQQLNQNLKTQALALGATRLQMIWTLILEARLALLAAIMAGYGRVIAEVGAVMIVGGNIRHDTRVLTTAIVLETRKGNFTYAIALGAILMALAFTINLALTHVQHKRMAQ